MGYITLQEKNGKTIKVEWKGEGKLKHGKGIDPSATLDGSFWFLDLNLSEDSKEPEEAPKPTPPPEPDTPPTEADTSSSVEINNDGSNISVETTTEPEIPA